MKQQSQRFKAAAIQPEMIAGKPEYNIKAALRLVRKALREKARLIVLPELFITGFDYDCIKELPQRSTDDCLRELRQIARKKSAVIVAGSVTVKKRSGRSTERTYNTSHVIGSDGRTKAVYSKMHLFPLMDEDAHLTAGDAPVAANTSVGKLAPCICFDIRFPEVVRHTALKGAQVLTVPAEFPHPRLDHWRTLLRARAIENQFFVVASNRVGVDGTGHFFGHSMIVNPMGEIMAEAAEKEAVLFADIDLAHIFAARAAIPCLDRINPAVALEIS